MADPISECAWHEWSEALLAGSRAEGGRERIDNALSALQQFPSEDVTAVNKRSNWRYTLDLPDTPVCASSTSPTS